MTDNVRAERRLLDQLEDAREDRNHYLRLRFLLSTITLALVVATIAGLTIGAVSVGTGVDLGLLASITGSFGIIGGLASTAVLFFLVDENGKNTKDALRSAERAHRDHFLDQA